MEFELMHTLYFRSFEFPDFHINDASNYCRNPKGYGSQIDLPSYRPWCYVGDVDNPDIEHCLVPFCSKF